MRFEQGTVPRPFLKWAGGKGQILSHLFRKLDGAGDFGSYHEPFLGGGAFFFGLIRANRLKPGRIYLSDNNPNLIEVYQGLQTDIEGVIASLRVHEACHGKDYYYQVRASAPEDLIKRAARLIYLNKTCFNGLFRENRRGKFNVPIGSYTDPVICDEANLRACSEALKEASAETRHFETVLEKASPGDFVYFDPPYHPVSKTASFTTYDKNGFGEDSQQVLAHVFAQLSQKGVKVLLSNSCTDFVLDLYGAIGTIEYVEANRAVNSRADRRGKVTEVLVRNY